MLKGLNMDNEGTNLLNDALRYLLAGSAGILGRIMYHLRLVQQGKQKSWVWIACDLVIALGMGWITLGVCVYFNLAWEVTQSMAIVAGWAGPHMIDRLIEKMLSKYFGGTVRKDEGLTPDP